MEQTVQPTWWRRNWKWALPVGCLAGLAFAAAIVGIIFASMKSSWAYSEGVNLVHHNEKVAARLGEPIETGWLVSGSISVTGPSGTANLAIPLHGSHETGTLYVVARKVAGQWQFDRAEVEVSGQEKRIDLLDK